MKMVIQSFQAPRWLAPVLALLALAILPFAFMFALVLLGLGAGALVLKTLLSPGGTAPGNLPHGDGEEPSVSFSDKPAIDADYEIKDPK